MLRLSVPVGVRLEAATQLDLHSAGAESNLASLLARLGWSTAWMGALPANALGRLAATHLRAAGVTLDGVVWEADGRMGTFYVEFADAPRPIQVIYDRADSSAARLQPSQVHWDLLLDTRLLHLTGITPALSTNNAEIIQQAIARARAKEISISFDVNYRSKLWDAVSAATALRPLIAGVDLLFCGQADAEHLFGCRGDASERIRQLAEQSGARAVVMSIGDGGVLAWDGTTIHHQPASAVHVIDRLGAGDALAAGVIHGWLSGDLAAGLRYGSMLAALALSQHGDMVITTRQELETLVAQQASPFFR